MALIRTSSTIWEDNVDPTVTSDSSVGYQVGDYHRNTVSKDVFYIKDDTVGAAVWVDADPSSYVVGGSVIECCPFGAKSDDTGKFLIANGKSSDADDSSKSKTRQPISADGTLTKLAYKTKEGTTSTQMKIHVNGVVQATVILSSLNANFGGVETISVSVTAGDYVEIEYDASDKPGECTMKFLQEL